MIKDKIMWTVKYILSSCNFSICLFDVFDPKQKVRVIVPATVVSGAYKRSGQGGKGL